MPKQGFAYVMGTVYGLVDPRTNEVRYVGQTYRTLEERLNDHLSKGSLNLPLPKNVWLKQLLKTGFEPTIIQLEQVIGKKLSKAEMKWIEHYRFQDCGLTNQYPRTDIRQRWITTFRNVEIKKKAG